MSTLLDLNPKQQKLVKRLKRIIDQMDKNHIGTVIQTRVADVSDIRFYNREKVVWSGTDEAEVDGNEELDKEDIESFCRQEKGNCDYLKEYGKLSWCCPDASEMYTIPFIQLFGKAPNSYQEPRLLSFLINIE